MNSVCFFVARGLVTEQVQWNDLTEDEKSSAIRQGFKPPEGAIIHGNLDIEHSLNGEQN